MTANQLNPGQVRALDALMSCPTQAEAAQKAECDVRTLRRYLALPAFAEALRDAQKAAVQQSSAALAESSGDAVAVLRAVMADTTAPHAAQVAAAKTLLQFAHQVIVDADVEARLAALEAERKGDKP